MTDLSTQSTAESTSSSNDGPPIDLTGRSPRGERSSHDRPDRGDRRELVTDRGRTTIADPVVAKVAGMASREVGGVHDMGGTASRAFGAIKETIVAGSSVQQGVSAEVGEREAAIDLDIVVEYGAAILDVAAGVRSNVIRQVERMTGLQVTEVNITVHDVHLPDGRDEGELPPPPRVQ